MQKCVLLCRKPIGEIKRVNYDKMAVSDFSLHAFLFANSKTTTDLGLVVSHAVWFQIPDNIA